MDSIAYERLGSGPPLVLLHGLGATRLVWKPQLELLAAEREVVALDMPGFGQSPLLGDETPPTAAAMAAAISNFLDGLGIERPHVAGNSLGGWVALEMAKAEKAASACLISPAGLWQNPLGPGSPDVRRLARRLKPLLLLAARAAPVRERALRSVAAHPERIPAADAAQLIRDWIEAPGYDASNEEMRGHVFADPAAIAVPVTIAWGERDRLVKPPRRDRRPPGAKLTVLPGCGHTPNWDDPELIARILLAASSTPARGGSRDSEAAA